ncbi:MAG: immune inhibitor A, partial [Muribaculaceae bacterium]|nr:immune inhibitor A [Muribaculaceae bacterium]
YVGVWVTGYIVGYVDTGIKSYATDESSKFSAPATVATNLLLANTPDEKDWNKCISVNLPSGSEARTQLNLKDNAGNLGKLLTIQGTVTRYVGISGVKEPTAFTLGEGGDTPAPPSTGETTVYSSLEKTLTALPSDWTIDNVTLPAGKTELWSWKTYNNSGYLNATGYGATSDGLSYAISPVIDLTGYTSAKASFRHAAKFQTTIKQLCGFVVREAGSSTWTEITIPTWPEAGAWTFVSSGDMDLSAFAGKKIQVAFKYGCSAAGADQWEINDLEVKASR